MGSLSKGLKAGLAAGVVYAVMIGLLHTGFFEVCSSYQMSFIQTQLANMNTTSVITTGTQTLVSTITLPSASDVFNTDLVVFSLDWAIGALILGLVYGGVYGVAYERLIGLTSKQKGLFMSIPVFLLGIVLGLSGWEIGCSPDYLHVIPVIASLPISISYGYLLGMLYDSFVAVEREERELASQSNEKSEEEK